MHTGLEILLLRNTLLLSDGFRYRVVAVFWA